MPVLFPHRTVYTRRVREFNQDHEGAGTPDRNGDGKGDGGQFADADGVPSGSAAAKGAGAAGSGAPAGENAPRRPPPKQPIGAAIEMKPETQPALKQLSEDFAHDPKSLAAKHFAYLQAHEPALVAEAAKVRAAGELAEFEFKGAMQQLAAQLDIEIASKPPEDPEISDSPISHLVLGPVKKTDRIAVKAGLEYDGDLRDVKDVLRSTIAVADAGGLGATMAALSEVAEIAYIKNSIEEPMPGGYRDLKVFIRLPKSGMLAEIQIMTKPMLKAKSGIGHQLYDQMRNLIKGSPQYQQLAQESESLYSAAWAASGASGAALTALTAFMRSWGGS